MKSEGQAADWVNQERLIRAHRTAADAALVDYHFTDKERQERREYYLGMAEKLESER